MHFGMKGWPNTKHEVLNQIFVNSSRASTIQAIRLVLFYIAVSVEGAYQE